MAGLDDPQLQKIADEEGFSDVMDLLEQCTFDSVAFGICKHGDCEHIQECEPDAVSNWCDACERNSVVSCLIIAGII